MPMIEEPDKDTMHVSAMTPSPAVPQDESAIAPQQLPPGINLIKVADRLFDEPGKLTLIGMSLQMSFIAGNAYIRNSGMGPSTLLPEGKPINGLSGDGWHLVTQGMIIEMGGEDYLACSIEGEAIRATWVGPHTPFAPVPEETPELIQPPKVEPVTAERTLALVERVKNERRAEFGRPQGQGAFTVRPPQPLATRTHSVAPSRSSSPPRSNQLAIPPRAIVSATPIALLNALHRIIQVPSDKPEEIAISFARSGSAQIGFKPGLPFCLSLGLNSVGTAFAVLECAADAHFNDSPMVQAQAYEMRPDTVAGERSGDRIKFVGAKFEVALRQTQAPGQSAGILYTLHISHCQS